jgi:uncharacterized protein YceH (UPF0502 family)
MSDSTSPQTETDRPVPRWQPIGARDRRVLSVLGEKAKTTPDTYPMSLNAVVTGSNQKSNRSPLMQLEPDDVQESLDRLRELGAVGMVEGYGRVTKYRHYLYDWLGVEKAELSVMIELLLRGAQTEGELRSHVSRMEPIGDLSALRAILVSLKAKGLVISLTPEGRGHVIAHSLYAPRELENLKVQFAQHAISAEGEEEEPPRPAVARPAAPSPAVASAYPASGGDSLRRELEDLRSLVSQLRSEVEELAGQQQQLAEEVRRLKDALGG